MESDSSLEKRGSVGDDAPAHNKPHLATQDVDVAAGLAAGNDFVLDPSRGRARQVCLSRPLPCPPSMTDHSPRAGERSTCTSCRSCAVSTLHLLNMLPVARADNRAPPQYSTCARRITSCDISSTHRFLRRMQFADKTTLGQSAVLGLLCVPRSYTSGSFSRIVTLTFRSHSAPGLITG